MLFRARGPSTNTTLLKTTAEEIDLIRDLNIVFSTAKLSKEREDDLAYAFGLRRVNFITLLSLPLGEVEYVAWKWEHSEPQ